MMEAEIVEPGRRPHGPSAARITQVRALGIIGTALAILTMLAAFGFGMLLLFGWTLISAGLAYVLWPVIFSPAFTEFVFGDARAPFWKLFLLFLVAGAVFKMFRRSVWPRK